MFAVVLFLSSVLAFNGPPRPHGPPRPNGPRHFNGHPGRPSGRGRGFNGTYWHNYVTDEGVTKITKCTFTNFVMSQITPGVAPTKVIFGLPDPSYAKTPSTSTLESPWGIVNVTETATWIYPSTYGNDTWDTDAWHADPRPHLLFFIGGVGEWKTNNNDTVKLYPGDVLLSDDHAVPNSHGHQARSISDHVLVHLNWELDAPSTKGYPCWLK